jgi:predicted  nucleic acid-binding Zn-ribbon protein
MKDLLEKLRRMNDLDLRRRVLQKDIERLPKELAEKKDRASELRTRIQRLREEARHNRIDAEAKELDLDSGQETIKRYAAQMNHVRTNKEMETIRRQMDAQRVWNKENEEKALNFLQKVEDLEGQAAKLRDEADVLDKQLAEEEVRVNKDVTEWKNELADLDAQRAEIAKRVPADEMHIYERAASNGQAVTKVVNGYCQACFMKMTAHTEDQVLLGRELVACSSCGRILTADVNPFAK